MGRIVFSAIACFIVYGLQAQVIEGIVYDANTRETIPGVYVYFDGTSISTTSDVEGKFKLLVNQKINSALVFRHMSYESLLIEHPFEHQETSFFLKEKINTLSGAVVVAKQNNERYTRAEKMAMFKRIFLGESETAKSCLILNEDDIMLSYDDEDDILTASSTNPIVIENKRLAYRITYDLHSFSTQFTNTVHSPTIISNGTTFSIKGTSLFEDLSLFNAAIIRRRDEAYQRSRENFWKNFVSGTLKEAKFNIYNRSREIKVADYFTIIESSPRKVVLINQGTNLNRFHVGVQEGTVYGVIGIIFDKKYQSEVIFRTNRFSVDENGNLHTLDDIVFIGDMCNQRIGDMLPLDYVYAPTQSPRRR